MKKLHFLKRECSFTLALRDKPSVLFDRPYGPPEDCSPRVIVLSVLAGTDDPAVRELGLELIVDAAAREDETVPFEARHHRPSLMGRIPDVDGGESAFIGTLDDQAHGAVPAWHLDRTRPLHAPHADERRLALARRCLKRQQCK